MPADKTIKISKYLSQAGIASRRQAETLVRQNLISVNGKIINNPAVRINPLKDKIIFRKALIKTAPKIYYLLHKPVGYVCTARDRHAEKLVGELVPQVPKVWPAGRLDKMTSGLLIMTNDGDLTLKLTHPRYKIEKEYEIIPNFPLSEIEIESVKKGVLLEDGFIRPDKFERIDRKKYRIVIHSGKKRVVRRIIEKIGKSVSKLKRIRVGSLELGVLPPGKWQKLSEKEISRIISAAKAPASE